MQIKTIWDAALILGLILLIIALVPMVLGWAVLYFLGLVFGIGILTPWTAFLTGLVIIALVGAWLVLT